MGDGVVMLRVAVAWWFCAYRDALGILFGSGAESRPIEVVEGAD
jgi:hypothetical protein